MKKREFKVGDSVRVIIENELHEFKSGDVVEVTRKIDADKHIKCQGSLDYFFMLKSL